MLNQKAQQKTGPKHRQVTVFLPYCCRSPPCPPSALLGFPDFIGVVYAGSQAQGCLTPGSGGHPNHTCSSGWDCNQLQCLQVDEQISHQLRPSMGKVTRQKEKLNHSIKLQLGDAFTAVSAHSFASLPYHLSPSLITTWAAELSKRDCSQWEFCHR